MSDKEYAWYEDPAVEYLYLASSTKNMRGYHAPIVNPRLHLLELIVSLILQISLEAILGLMINVF